MDAARPRFITGPDTPLTSPSQLELGLNHALSVLVNDKSRILLVVKTRGVLNNVLPRLTQVLGAGAKRLWQQRQSDDVPIKVVGDRDFLPFNWSGPVLLIYPDAKMLSEVGKINDVTAEVVVPWTEHPEVTTWKATWSPLMIGAAQPVPQPPSLDPVAEVALRSLVSLVNVNNGMVDREKRDTVEIFGTLIAFGPTLDSTAVRAWLVRQGEWPGEMADAAQDILNDLRAGKKFRGYNYPNRERYERWVAKVKEAP